MSAEQSRLGGFVVSERSLGLTDGGQNRTQKIVPDGHAITNQTVAQVARIAGISEEDITQDLENALFMTTHASGSLRGMRAMTFLFGNSIKYIVDDLGGTESPYMIYLGASFILEVLTRKQDSLANGLEHFEERQYTTDEQKASAYERETTQYHQLTEHTAALARSIALHTQEQWGESAQYYVELLDRIRPASVQSTVMASARKTYEKRTEVLPLLQQSPPLISAGEQSAQPRGRVI